MRNLFSKSLMAAIAALSLSIPTANSSTNAEYEGYINGLYVDNNGRVLVAIDNGTTKPNCEQNAWDFSFKLDSAAGQAWFNYLLAAKTAKKVMKVGYIPNAEARCSVNYFYQLD